MRVSVISFFLLLAVLVPAKTKAQNFTYPVIRKTAASLNAFVPPGWEILDSATGDLNKDSADDVAFILQHRDSVPLTEIISRDTETVVTQPRILVIAFRDVKKKKYTVQEQSNTFILCHDQENMSDPYVSMRISGGVLQLDFQLFCNMGCWDVTNLSYKFRFQENEFVLIGADYSTMNRASLDFDTRSYNFLTKKWSRSTGSDKYNTHKTEWLTLDVPAMKTLRTFTRPLTWEVTKDLYL
ncbi:MAG TPA: hypothetical protein VFU15_14650 [Bacteroidia bacterium]|nr:hypothetical protein [Bacteroidia bacterium]